MHRNQSPPKDLNIINIWKRDWKTGYESNHWITYKKYLFLLLHSSHIIPISPVFLNYLYPPGAELISLTFNNLTVYQQRETHLTQQTHVGIIVPDTTPNQDQLHHSRMVFSHSSNVHPKMYHVYTIIGS